MAVVAPVRAEDEQQAFVFCSSFLLRFLNFSMRVGSGRVDFFRHAGGLLQMREIRSRRRQQMPLPILLLPGLRISNGHRLSIVLIGNNVRVKNNAAPVGARCSDAHDFQRDAARFKSQPEVGIVVAGAQGAVLTMCVVSAVCEKIGQGPATNMIAAANNLKLRFIRIFLIPRVTGAR